MMQRRTTLRLALAAAAAPALSAHAQGAFPGQPITVVVPFAAGGNLDVMARVVGVPMGKALGQPIIIDNRAGAGGAIGHEYTARAEPNGYTLVCTANGSFAVTPRLMPKRPFQASDFAPIGMIGVTPLVLEVPAASRFKDFADMLAYAKANPGKVSIAHSGNGTTNHIAILRMQEATGAQFTIVPYKGSGPALNDLLGSQVDAMVDQLPSSLAHLKAEKLRPLAVTTAARAPDLPNTPTLAELGLAKFDVSTAAGLLAPAKTPAAVVEQLNKALNGALADADVQKRLRELGTVPMPMTAAKFRAFLMDEDAKAEAMFKSGAIKAE